MASSTDESEVNEANRDVLYKLYDYALQLEPTPDRPELTWGQLQLVNKARSFVTMKMRKRQNMRVQKQAAKGLLKFKKMMANQLALRSANIGQDAEGEIEEKIPAIKKSVEAEAEEQDWVDITKIKDLRKLGDSKKNKVEKKEE